MDGAIVPVAAAASCHGGKETMLAAARAAGKSEMLERMAADYPKGPHDQPQSMCPAFGSLRVGLRMRRVATILSGSACCVYGLTFTSHFYGARRSVGYVPFDSETLVTGQLYEDIRKAVFETARPADYDAVVIINLCVPTASGVPLDLLPKEIDGVRIIGIDVPGFGVPTHAEAKDVLAGAMLKYARGEAERGAVARPRAAMADGLRISLIGELFPADPQIIGSLLAPMGVSLSPGSPAREWRDLYGALDCSVVGAVHPFYTATVREFAAAGRPVVGSAPVGVDGTADWLDAVGKALGVSADSAKAKALPGIKAVLEANRVNARMVVSGYEGSELLVARLLMEAGAEVEEADPGLPDTRDIFGRIWGVALARLVNGFPETRRHMLDPGLLEVARSAAGLSAIEFLDGEAMRVAAAHAMARFHQKYDLVLCPAVPAVAPLADAPVTDPVQALWTQWAPWTFAFNLTRQPAISVPMGFTASGLPRAVQLAAPIYRDDLVLRAARAIEIAQPFVMPDLQ